jgi:hypothetical protein
MFTSLINKVERGKLKKAKAESFLRVINEAKGNGQVILGKPQQTNREWSC